MNITPEDSYNTILMLSKTKKPIHQRLSRFFIVTSIETFLTILFIMAIPKSAKNAWLLGFSKTRYLMVLPVVLLALILVWLAIRFWKDVAWADRLSQRFQTALENNKLQGLADFSVLTILSGAYLLIKWGFFLDRGFDYQTAVMRITPYLLLVTLYSVQIVLTVYPRFTKEKPEDHLTFPEKARLEILRHKQLPIVLILFSAGFTLAHIAGWELRSHKEWINTVMFFIDEFNMDNEYVLQSYFSGLLLLTAGFLLCIIAAYKKKVKASFVLQWTLLGIIFLYMAVDEVIQIHEHWQVPLSNLITSKGYFSIDWVRSAVILVAIFGLLYIRFFFKLPRKSMLLFGLSGTVYLMGVLGLEMLAGEYVSTYHQWGYDYGMLVAREETLEMIGISLFIFALLDYIRQQLPKAPADSPIKLESSIQQ